ncbi:MAG: hypothetical protein J6Q22_10590 [Prevotella sp.]|nr:hypothetical protein [Prevotella sp.]
MTIEVLIERLGNVLSAGIVCGIRENLPELMKQLEANSEEIASKNRVIETLEARLAEANARITELEFAKVKADDAAKEQAWIANELGKFVSDVANGFYEGQEIAAARRIYDLNGGSLKKKRINAADYETEEDARSAFEKQFRHTNYSMKEYLDWLFSNVTKGLYIQKRTE